jgi:outer membrane protein TolC
VTLTAILGLLVATPGVRAQTPDTVALSMSEAVAMALEENGTLRAATARTDAAQAAADANGGFILPQVQATAGAMRTNDPVGVFGTKLRQGIFTEADFALPSLNDPDAVADWTAGLSARWEIGDWSRWQAREGGQARSRAARAGLQRTREGTVFQTRILYARALQAQEAEAALAAALTAAEATRERVGRRVAEGMGTDADRLQAEAAVQEIEARRVQARAMVMDTREALAVHLGWGSDRLPTLVETPETAAGRLAAEMGDANLPPVRADLLAGRATVEAAEAAESEIQARRLPRLEGYGMLSTHAPEISGDWRSNYTVGVQLSIPLFTGFSLTNGAEAARAEARALAEEQEERERAAHSELASAERGVAAAEASLESARSAAGAAAEAARLVRLRYEEGMATVAELLQAQARSAALDQGVAEARARLIMALAALDFARGDTDATSQLER